MSNILALVITLICFRVVLDLSYVDFVQPMFYYMGFNYELNIYRYILSWFVYFISFFFLNKFINKVSDYFIVTCIIFLMAPTTSMFGLDYSLSPTPVLLCVMSISIIRILLVRKVKFFPNFGVVPNGYIISIVVSFLLIMIVAANLYRSGVNLNFNPEDVYKFRDSNAELADVGFFAYLNNWVYQIISMFLLVAFLSKKSIIGIFAVLVLQFFFFAASAHKAVLFMPFMVFGLWFVLEKSNKTYYITSLYLGFVLFLYLYYLVVDDILLPSIFIRRAFFIPSQLNFFYYEFFSVNEFVFWSQSVLSNFIEYPFDTDISSLIGSWAFGDDTRANNGLISSGYANAGVFGVIIYSVVLGLVLRLIDDLSIGRFPIWFPVSLTAIPLNVAMIQADLLTSILTHGLIVSIFLLFLARKKKF